MSIVYVGLDLGSSNFQQVALNHDGVSRVNRDFATSEANLVIAFSDLKGEKHVHLEAGELAPWAASVIAPLVTRVVCSHRFVRLRRSRYRGRDGHIRFQVL